MEENEVWNISILRVQRHKVSHASFYRSQLRPSESYLFLSTTNTTYKHLGWAFYRGPKFPICVFTVCSNKRYFHNDYKNSLLYCRGNFKFRPIYKRQHFIKWNSTSRNLIMELFLLWLHMDKLFCCTEEISGWFSLYLRCAEAGLDCRENKLQLWRCGWWWLVVVVGLTK